MTRRIRMRRTVSRLRLRMIFVPFARVSPLVRLVLMSRFSRGTLRRATRVLPVFVWYPFARRNSMVITKGSARTRFLVRVVIGRLFYIVMTLFPRSGRTRMRNTLRSVALGRTGRLLPRCLRRVRRGTGNNDRNNDEN